MKKITLLFASLLCVAYIAMAQLKLYVYQNDGTRTEFVASTVDSIAFSTITDGPDQPDDPIKPVDPTNGHEYVDLGLPSGTKWATMNVGADSPEDYGDYFAWGETTTKSTYNWSTYKWCNGSYNTQTKYCTESVYGTVDNKTTLDLSDDAAYVNWGGDWRMPTKAEQDELRNTSYTTWFWITQNGVKGYKVTSKINGNSIFLPAAGYRNISGLDYAGSNGCYWSSSLDTYNSSSAYDLYFGSDYVNSGAYYRYTGQSVRPVWRDVEFTFTLMFDGNGGEGSMPAIDGQHDDNVIIPASTFTREGYDFVCWNTKADGTGTSYAVGQTILIKQNIILYAQWQKVFTVSFNANGGSGTMPAVELAIDESFNIPSSTFIYSINEFLSWNTKPDGSGNEYTIGQIITIIEDITLYAQWKLLVGTENGHEWVDLGLPSKTKWATMNVGATSPEGYGSYYAWGETRTKASYHDTNYTYSGNSEVLSLSNDAAFVNWGGKWKMPTKSQQDELQDTKYCTWTWTTQNGVKGYKVTSKINGNSIFLPAAGCRSGSDLLHAGSSGYYWSSSLNTSDSYNAYSLYFNSGSVFSSSGGGRFGGLSVRPVLAE